MISNYELEKHAKVWQRKRAPAKHLSNLGLKLRKILENGNLIYSILTSSKYFYENISQRGG